MDKMYLHWGQTVFIKRNRSYTTGLVETKVTKVGRKYTYFAYQRMRVENGYRGIADKEGRHLGSVYLSQEEYDYETNVRQAWQQIRADIWHQTVPPEHITAESIAAIRAILTVSI